MPSFLLIVLFHVHIRFYIFNKVNTVLLSDEELNHASLKVCFDDICSDLPLPAQRIIAVNREQNFQAFVSVVKKVQPNAQISLKLGKYIKDNNSLDDVSLEMLFDEIVALHPFEQAAHKDQALHAFKTVIRTKDCQDVIVLSTQEWTLHELNAFSKKMVDCLNTRTA